MDVKDKKHRRIFNLLEKIARDIPIDLHSSNTARIASAIVIANDIVSFGVNQNKTHPLALKFARNSNCHHLHSEIDAIKNALKRIEKLNKATLYVLRIKYDSPKKKRQIWGLSKPCVGCQKAIMTFEIPKVIYTNEGDSYSVVS